MDIVANKPVLARRELRNTGVFVDAFGLGTAPIGNLYETVSDGQAREALDVAFALGVRTYDTAPHYGLGLSERRLAEAVKDRQGELTIITKAGRMLDPAPAGWTGEPNDPFVVPPTYKRRWDFSAEGVRRSLESSLKRLGLPKVEGLLLHDPENHVEEALRDALPALVDLKAAGLVGAIGIGTKHTPTLKRFIETGAVDVALMAGRYTLLEQGSLNDVLPAAVQAGTSILIAGVFNSGLLAQHNVPDAITYEYRQAPPEIIHRARAIAAICEKFGTTLPAAAMLFPLAHPAVAGAIVGARSANEVRADIGFLSEDIDDGLWRALQNEGLLRQDVPLPSRS